MANGNDTPTPAPDTTAVKPTPAPTPTPAAPQPAPASVPQPAVAPASAAPAAMPGVHGIMGSMVIGALKGAAQHIAKKAGNELRTVAQNSPYGQELQKNALARQAEQQENATGSESRAARGD